MGIFGNNNLKGSFKLNSAYQPTGDQPQAIDRLTAGVEAGISEQTLLGVTGSGKTFTMANIIARLNKPTLVLAHNKTLAAQLCSEFREFFPDNAVEYFVSYYDYYQPEAYIPGKDLYIEKDSAVNDEIDRLRHSATSALFERRDVIIVASVSCIYSLGDPNAYEEQVLALRTGAEMSREQMIARLISMNYTRNDVAFARDRFRVRGDVVEVLPASQDKKAIRVEFWGDEIDRITEVNIVTGEVLRSISYACIFPATHYAISAIARALVSNPSILLADEPTGALDQKTGRQVMALFRELNEEGRTIIMITHDVGIAGNASRIVRILDGELSEGVAEDA